MNEGQKRVEDGKLGFGKRLQAGSVAVAGEVATATSSYLRSHLERLDIVANKLDDANTGLHNLADRLLGTAPPEDGKGAVQAAPDGIVGECQDRAGLLEDKADQILFALSRLQQVA
ncbi:MAG: hypothetical protein V3S33_03970 [Gammaproteobacteria bacterium]